MLLQAVPAQGAVRAPSLDGCEEEMGVSDAVRCKGGGGSRLVVA